MAAMTLYHGSSQMLEKPEHGKGRPYNDYGRGFYCTQHIELAREWACSQEGIDGFANAYEFDAAGLSVLNLSDESYTILHWLALLLAHRIVDARTPVAMEGMAFLEERFMPDIDGCDAIVGYRADDSYFTFARSFLSNGISLEQLSRAMRLGDLGEQIMVKSPRAFDRLSFLGAEPVDSSRYYPKRLARDERARKLYREEAARQGIDGIYLRDILQGAEVDFAGLR